MKLKYLLIYYFLVLSVFSCSQGKEETRCENILIPKESIKALLDSFVLENKHNNYVYELYIDKQDPDNYNLLLYAGDKSLMEKENEVYKQTPIASVLT
jgi:hypothetical protein